MKKTKKKKILNLRVLRAPNYSTLLHKSTPLLALWYILFSLYILRLPPAITSSFPPPSMLTHRAPGTDTCI